MIWLFELPFYMNVKCILSSNLFGILTLVLHVNVYAYQRFSPKGVRACVRTHPDNTFECMLSRRSACQSYLALGQCIRNVLFLCSCFMLHKRSRKYINPFILVVHYNFSIFRAVELRATRP